MGSGRDNRFASFVTFASVGGIALGVAALIVVLSVMNGFQIELRDRLLSLTAHGMIEHADGLDRWQELRRSLISASGIEGAAPYVEAEAMLTFDGELEGALVTGVDPALEDSVSNVSGHMLSGSLDQLVAGGQQILLGRGLALALGVQTGDALNAMVPVANAGGRGGIAPRLRRFQVAGVFEMGVKDHDARRAIVHIEDAAALAGLTDKVSGIRVRTEDILKAPSIIAKWRTSALPVPGIVVSDWTDQNVTYFRAVRIEKTMMAILLSLIVAVAAFNIVATLVMTVTDKRAGIAILRTCGYPRRTIVGVFAFLGLVLGWLGCLLGVAGGVALAENVDVLAPILETVFGFEFMPADVYYLTNLPSDLRAGDVVAVAGAAFLMTGLATIYPALRASTVDPAEVLRYE
jgi:lipoprotein-releasing system permease protein